jgi:hypothetical protein
MSKRSSEESLGSSQSPNATADGSMPEGATLLTNLRSGVSSQLSKALNEWLAGLAVPQNPPFRLGADFPDSEWWHLLRVLSVSTAIAGFAVGVGDHLQGHSISFVPDSKAVQVLGVFGCFGAIYHYYSKLFGIKVNIKQSLFCFALVTVPWFPFYAFIKAAGASLGPFWFPAMVGLWLVVIFFISRSLQIVSGASLIKTTLSLLVLAVVLVFVSITGQTPSSPDSPPTPAPANDAH